MLEPHEEESTKVAICDHCELHLARVEELTARGRVIRRGERSRRDASDIDGQSREAE